jgi:iron complex outermembrane recepter protein
MAVEEKWFLPNAVLAWLVCFGPAAVAQTASSGESRSSAAETSPQQERSRELAPAEATAVEGPRRPRTAEEEVVVTGSRIRRKDLTTPAPVTVINREQVVASGKVSIGDFLQSLPEQGNAINTAVNNGGNGSTRVSLRGLGTSRTLVLLNGRRMVPGGTGADQSVDLNSLPTAAIERIEVLKDGASAVYGSDAIAGVVNIITRRNYRGTEVTGYSGTALGSRADGNTYDLGVTTGIGGDLGNVTFNGGYFNQQSVWAGDRDWANIPRAYDATGRNNPLGIVGQYTLGSPTLPQSRITIRPSERSLPGTSTLYQNLVSRYPTATSFIVCSDAEKAGGACPLGWRPYVPFLVSPQGDAYNFQPDNYLLTPQQRISLYSAGDVRLGSFVRGFFEGSYVNRQSDQKLAAEPLLIGPGGESVIVSASNLYNPFNRDLTQVRRRLTEFGNRTFNQDIDTFRVVGGIDGTLPDEFGALQGWAWDAAVNYGRTSGDNVKRGNLDLPHLRAAVGPSGRDPKTNAPVCVVDPTKAATGTNVIAGCVPLNLFGGPGSITDEQMAGLTFTGTARGTNQLAGFNFNTSGELFRVFADRPLGLALGYEFRNVKGSNLPDPITVLGETTGNKGAITQGGYNVHEGYGELSIPVLNNVPGAQTLEGTVAARVFRYSTFGSDFTYKFGARWSPIRDFTLRGTYSTAFRAPGVLDLFRGPSDSFPGVKDPCRGPGAGGPTPPPNCGSAANNGDTANQLRTQLGGDSGLQPETARIFTTGVVIEPSMVKNFTVTVDYYNIRVYQPILPIGADVILSGCYPSNGNAPNTAFCNLISRDPSTGIIQNIVNLTTNVGRDWTDGIDLAVRYAYPSDYGRFGFIFDGTWLHKFDRTLGDGTIIRGRGTFDLGSGSTGGVYPAFKFNAGTSWQLGGLAAGVNTRFIGSFHECSDANGDFSGGGLCYQSPAFRRLVPAYNTYDVYVNYTLRSRVGRSTLAAGVNNVFGAKPAVIYNGFLAATDPTAYDVVGRFGYVRLSQTF